MRPDPGYYRLIRYAHIVMRSAEVCNLCDVSGVSELVVGTVKTRTLESDRRSSVDPPKGSIPTVGTHL